MSTEQSRQQGKKTPSSRTSEDNKTVAKRAWRQSVLLLAVVFAAVPVVGVVVELYFHKRTVEPTLPRQTLSISNVIEPVRDAIESFTGEQETSDPKEIDDEQENTRAHLQRQ